MKIDSITRLIGAFVLLVIVAMCLQTAAAAGGDTDQRATPESEQDASYTRNFGGPEGVAMQLERNYRDKDPTFDTGVLEHYFDRKRQLRDDKGAAFGFRAFWLYQYANKSLSDENDAFGQIYRLQGSWTLFGRNTGHPGGIEARLEYRSNVGGLLSPAQLSSDIGTAALNPGFGYPPKFDLDLAVFNWTQWFNNQTTGVAIGRLAVSAYLDAFAFQSASGGFLNRGFRFNPTLGRTGLGALGAVLKAGITKHIWLGGQIYDGNAVSGQFDMDTFQQGEWLKALEIGLTSSFDRYETDRIQFTYWHKDERSQAGVPSGQGWVVSASWKIHDRFFPFLRFGHSDGGAGVAAESTASTGLELTIRPDQAWCLGFAWAKSVSKTSNVDARDEYVLETSYKLQLLQALSLLPDVQLVLNPANNPAEDRIWVIGIRGILTL